MYIFVFKQKTAYEMRISDWSSDVCSADLLTRISPSSAMRTSTPFIGGPTVSMRMPAPGRLHEMTGDASVWPYPCRSVSPSDWKNSPPSLLSGAPPDTMALIRPPTRLRTLGRTVRSSRSEEHTSELPSLMRSSYAVFCLKKNRIKHRHTI